MLQGKGTKAYICCRPHYSFWRNEEAQPYMAFFNKATLYHLLGQISNQTIDNTKKFQ